MDSLRNVNGASARFDLAMARFYGIEQGRLWVNELEIFLTDKDDDLVHVLSHEGKVAIFVSSQRIKDLLEHVSSYQWRQFLEHPQSIRDVIGFEFIPAGPEVLELTDRFYSVETNKGMSWHEIEADQVDAFQGEVPTSEWKQAGFGHEVSAKRAFVLRDGSDAVSIGGIFEVAGLSIATGAVTYPRARRNGFGSEITKRLTNEVLKNSPIRLMRYSPDNVGSEGLARRLDFQPYGMQNWLSFGGGDF